MNRTTIDWPYDLKFTHNPSIGCKHNCQYCYARQLHDKRHIAYINGAKLPHQYALPFNEYQFFEDRLVEPLKIQKPATIFIGSMCDQFGDWVPETDINEILHYCKKAPQHLFMFLTKNGKRLYDFDFPSNCAVGVTVTSYKDVMNITAINMLNTDAKKFVSIEPIMSDFSGIEFNVDTAIVGAMTNQGKNNIIPKKNWINSINHNNIHFKKNIKKYL